MEQEEQDDLSLEDSIMGNIEGEFLSFYGGYPMLVAKLCGDDFTKLESIYAMEVNQALYWASYLIVKDKVEAERMRKSMQKHKK